MKQACSMQNCCAVIYCDGKVFPQTTQAVAAAPLLFFPLLGWAYYTLCQADIPQICVLMREQGQQEQLQAALSRAGADCAFFTLERREELRDFCAGRELCLFPANSLFFDCDALRGAYERMQETQQPHFALKADGGRTAALWLANQEAQALFTEMPERILAAQRQNSLEGVCLTDIANAQDCYRATEQMRHYLLQKHRESGVQIPCSDGIMIAPDCEIGAGTLVLPGTILKQGVRIGGGCTIGPNSVISGSVIGERVLLQSSYCEDSVIQDDATVGPFARLRPNTRLGKAVRAGNFVELKNTAVGDGAKISHLSYIGDSEIGARVNVGCLCATANYDGKDKYVTKVADDSFLGCNTVLISPVTLEKNAFTAAGSVITQDVPENALAIARSRQVNKDNWRNPKNR